MLSDDDWWDDETIGEKFRKKGIKMYLMVIVEPMAGMQALTVGISLSMVVASSVKVTHHPCYGHFTKCI